MSPGKPGDRSGSHPKHDYRVDPVVDMRLHVRAVAHAVGRIFESDLLLARLTSVALHITLNPMIKSFRHKGLELFFTAGKKSGIQPHHAPRLRLQLTALDHARQPQDLSATGWRLHPLTGKERGFWSITVSGNWRLVFRFDRNDVELVDYLDYH
jgi:toxin HigB-1